MPRVVVCGLGPGSPELVTTATLAAIERIPHRFLRTRRHPSAAVAGKAEDFDHLYEAASTIDEVYEGIVAALAAAAEDHGQVLYAVPGSPLVAESTVERLRAHPRLEVAVVPALSFLDLAWDRLGLDPLDAGLRLVDAHRFATEAAGERGPLLVAQCDSRPVLSDIKLALADSVPVRPAGAAAATPGPPVTVTVLQRLGLPDEQVVEVPWSELDRSFDPDHLTSLFIPHLAAPLSGEVAAFAEIARRLRRDCPWDRIQTHASLRRHLIEEAYEVLEAIDHLDPDTGEGFDALEEELGDLLFQVVFHATLAAEEGWFDLADVARHVSQKLVGRHPHVFGDVEVANADEVVANWEQLKKAEKGRSSMMDGIPVGLPALLFAQKVQKRAASGGVDWRDLADLPDRASRAGGTNPAEGPDLARRLLDLVDEAGAAGHDPESELRAAAEAIRDRFRKHEANGIDGADEAREVPGA